MAMTGLAILWKNKAATFPTTIILYMLLVLSLLLYGCEGCRTFTADLERRIQAFENKCCIRMLDISYKEHKNERVRFGSRSVS